MDAFIISSTAFIPEIMRPALDWDLCRDSAETEKSTVLLPGGDIPRSRNGDWLLIDGSLYRISNVMPADGQTKLELQLPEDAFSRPRMYAAPPAGSSIGDFIARELAEGWRDEPDPVYAMPYLLVSNQDTTPFVSPEEDSNGLYSLADYMRTVRRLYDVRVVFTVGADGLKATVRKTRPGEAVLIPDDGHTKLKTASFSGSSTAKITTIRPVDTGEVDELGEKIFRREVLDWYLSASGEISQTMPETRATGSWSQLILSEKTDPAEAVAAQFAKNSESYKIEVWYDGELQVLDNFTILLGGDVVRDRVESVWTKRGESRSLIKAGQQARSLTEKVRSGSSGSGGRSGRASSSGSQEIPAGSLFFTVLEGNPAEILGYGAWTLLKDVTLVGAGNKWSANTIVGADEHTLTKEELPSLDLPVKYGASAVGGQQTNAATGTNLSLLRVGNSGATVKLPGEGQAISLVQRSFALYIWLRKE